MRQGLQQGIGILLGSARLILDEETILPSNTHRTANSQI